MPLAYASLAYGAVWALRLGSWNSEFVSQVAEGFGLRGLPAWASLTLYIISMATGGLILNLSTTLGEEIGWRGFLVPELAKQMSFTRVSLVERHRLGSLAWLRYCYLRTTTREQIVGTRSAVPLWWSSPQASCLRG